MSSVVYCPHYNSIKAFHSSEGPTFFRTALTMFALSLFLLQETDWAKSPFSTELSPVIDDTVLHAPRKELFPINDMTVTTSLNSTEQSGKGRDSRGVRGGEGRESAPAVHIRAFMAGVVEQEMSGLVSEYFLTTEGLLKNNFLQSW